MRIFADTNVLFPYSVMDLMLALAEDQVHDIVWTDFLLDEWERVIVREGERTPDSAAKLSAVVREFFADCRIAPEAYVHLIDDIPGSDVDDRNHMAAAVAAECELIVTSNLADFPAEPLAALGLRVLTPDAYLCELLADTVTRPEVVKTVQRLAAEKKNPPMNPAELLNRVGKIAPTFAAKARPYLTGS